MSKTPWLSLNAAFSPTANLKDDYSTTTRVTLSSRDSIDVDCYGPLRWESGRSLTNVLVVEQSQVAKTESFHSCVVLEGVSTLQSLKEAVKECHARGSNVVLVEHGQWSKDLLEEIDQGLYAPTNFLMLFQEKDKPKVMSWVRFMKLTCVAEIMQSCEWHEDITTVYAAYVRLVDSLPSSYLKLLSQDYSLIPTCTQQNFPFILDFICVYYNKMGEGVSGKEKAKMQEAKKKECMAVLQAHVIDRKWSVEAVQQAAACIPTSEFFNSILLEEESRAAKKNRNTLNELWQTFMSAKDGVPKGGPGSRVLERYCLRNLTPAQLVTFSGEALSVVVERGDIRSMSVKEAWKLFTDAKLDAPHALLQLFVSRRCRMLSTAFKKHLLTDLLGEVKALQSECGPDMSDLYGGAIDPSVFAESPEAAEWIASIRDEHPRECALLLLPQLAVAWHWPDTAMRSVSQEVVSRSLTSQEGVLSMCALCTTCGIQEPLLSMVAEEVRSSHFIVSNVVEAFDRFPKRYKRDDTSNHTVWDTLSAAFIHAVFINARVTLDSSAMYTNRPRYNENTTMKACVAQYVWVTMGAKNHLKDASGLLTIIQHAACKNKTMLVWAVEFVLTGEQHVLAVEALLSSVTNSPLRLLTDIDQALRSCSWAKLSFLRSKFMSDSTFVSDVRSAVVEAIKLHAAAWGTIAAWSRRLHWLASVVGDTAIPENVKSLTRTTNNEKLSLSSYACQQRKEKLVGHVHVLLKSIALLDRASRVKSTLFEANIRDAFKQGSAVIPDDGEDLSPLSHIKATINSAVFFTRRILKRHISVDETIHVASILPNTDALEMDLTAAYDVVFVEERDPDSKIKLNLPACATTLQLVPLASELRPYLSRVFTRGSDGRLCALKALGFACHNNPQKELHHARVFHFVRRHESTTESVESRDMENMVRDLMAALGTQNPREAVNLVALLASLRTGAYHLWEFFGKNPHYVSEKGGLSDTFERRIDEEFIPYLKGAREHIFKAFRQCSYVVAALRAHAECDALSALGKNVLASRHVSDQLRSDGFVERVEAVSQNMDMISSLFDNGINSVESAIRRFQCIEEGCVYVFDLLRGEMSACFYEAAMKEVSYMGSTDLRDFQQLLSLVTHSQSAHTDSANKYVDWLGTLSAALRCMVELHALGHPKFNVAKVRLGVGNCSLIIAPPAVSESSAAVSEADIAGIQSTLDSWQEKVTGAFASNAMLSLLSVKSAQVLAGALVGKKDLDTVVRQMGPLLPKGNGSEAAQRDAIKEIKQCLQQFGYLRNGNVGWLSVVQRWLSMLPAHCFFSASAAAMSPVCRVYTNCTTPADVLKALADLYTVRPPLPFEYLRCTPTTSELQVAALRDRSRLHPKLQFVMVGSRELSVSAQEILFDWLSNAAEASNISLIEEDANILHTLRWLPHVSCSELQVDVAATIKQRWRSADMAVQCFTGPPGSGKSYQVSRHTASASGVHCSVNITENFDMGAAVEELRRRVPVTGTDDAALAITFSCGVYDEHTTATGHASALRLASDMNHFLFALLVLRDLEDPVTGQCASVVGAFTWRVFIEVPHQLVASTADDALLPLLPHLDDISCARDYRIDLDASDIDTAKYLRAYKNGMIDSMYHGNRKDVIFVLDVSGSMMGHPLAACQDALLQHILPDKIHKGDRVGFISFNHQIQQRVPMEKWAPVHHTKMKEAISPIYEDGGTAMWPAVETAIQELRSSTTADVPQWVVVLTDGVTDQKGAESVTTLLSTSEKDGEIGMLFITINLPDTYQAYIATVCNLQNHDAFISVSNSREAIIEGWNKAGERLCDRIEREGADITEDEARALLFEHMRPADHPEWSRVHICYWLRYMARRRHILKCSKNFNTNSSRPNFGSLTMRMMLGEVEHAVSALLGWREAGHRHMVYYKETDEEDGTENYDWSIVATDCEADKRWNETRAELLGNGMCPPTAEDLADPGVLESYLAAVIGAPLVGAAPRSSSSAGTQLDIPVGRLDLIRTRRFVLTADFLMKMITLHERVECGVPCILVGETGVSKTALTRMYFELRNSAQAVVGPLQAKLQAHYASEQLGGDATSMHSVLFPDGEEWEQYVPGLLAELRVNIQCAPTNAIVDQWLPLLLSEEPSEESFQEVSKWWVNAETQRQAKAGSSSSSSPLFEMINVDATTTPDDIREVVRRVKTCSEQFSKMGTLLGGSVHDKVRFCVFFDEFNTTSCMGFIKALLQDHRMDGDELPRNIVFVAAANPAREKISFHDKRKEEHALAWVATHYQVHSIPPALRSVAWDYGSLSEKQEREFIERLLGLEALPNASRELVTCFAAAHSLCRELATNHVAAMAGCALTDEEKKARSQSVVSLRDILRVVHIYRFLAGSLSLSSRPCPVDHRAVKAIRWKVGLTKQKGPAAALLLSIAIVYYLRLGIDENCEDDYRMRFRNIFRSRVSLQGFDTDVEAILKPALEGVSEASIVPAHVVKGRGLDEVILTTIVCLAAGVPLMIIGPPGCGKTLGVTVAIDNARGDLAQSSFYRELPKLLATQYQCTRHSNSIDVDNICIRAKAAQAEANGRKDPSLHFVFMDEAGLPEEERESLKVLHYHLEGPNRVGFIGISNHVLDAAKSNRSMQLHLRRAGVVQLVEIASMYLMCHGEIRSSICRSGRTTPVALTGDADGESLVHILCAVFSACMRGQPSPFAGDMEAPPDFCEHFGQRDFMRFMATIGQLAARSNKEVTVQTVHLAIARNFSCPDTATTRLVTKFFLAPFECSVDQMALSVPCPVSMIRDFIADSSLALAIPTRYTLVIDETASEGVVRALQRLLRDDKGVCTDMHRVTEFGADLENSQARLVGRVCWAMQHSEVAILCNAGTINESLYNLYNQHFGRFDNGTPHSHVYVAFRTESQLRQVSPGFYCMVAVSQRQYNALPAPFLDRFAKLPVSFAHILQHIMSGENKQSLFKEVPALRTALEDAYCKSLEFIVAVGDGALYGVRPHQTVESALACVLAEWGSASDIEEAINRGCENQSSLMAACVQQSEVCRRLCKCPLQDGSLAKVMTSESTTSDAHSLLAHVLLSCVVERLLLVAIPEEIVPRLHLLPKWLAEHYLTPPYFSICLPANGGARKLVVTRLSEFSVRQLCEPRDTAVDTWMFLSQFTRESHFVDELTRHCTSSNSNSGPPKTIAVVASTTTSSLSQVNFTVSTINAIFGQNDGQQQHIKANVIVIVCVPGLDAVHHTYDAVFEPGWSVQFLESSASSLNLLPWLLAGFMECNNNSGDGDDGIKRHMQELLRSWLPSATERAVEMIVSGDKLTSDDTWDSLDRIIGSQRTGEAQAARDMLIDQFYEEVWSLSRRRKDGLRGSIGDEIVQCVRAHAEERRCIPLVYSLEADVRHMFQQFVSMWVCELLASPTSSSSVPVEELLWLGLRTMHTRSAGALRKATLGTMRCRPTSQGGIPFFGLVFGCLKRISQEVIASYAQDEDEDGCVWQRMTKTAEEYLRDSVDSAAPLARKCVELAITCPGLVPLYIDNLAAAMLPGGSEEQLQFITDTLKASLLWDEGCDPSTVLLQLHLEVNAALVTVTETAPLDALPSKKSLRNLLRTILEEGKTAHTATLISEYCTESLRYCSTGVPRLLPKLLQALQSRQLAQIACKACRPSKKGSQGLPFLMVHSVYTAARLLGTSDADMSPLISVLMGTFLSTTAELKSLPDVWSLLWGAIKTAGRAADMAVIAFMKFLLHCPSFLVASGDMLLSLTQGLYGDAAINKSAHLSSLCGVALTVAYNAQCALGRSPLDALRSMCDCSTLRSLAVSPETLFTACKSKVEPFLATTAKWLCWQLGCVARPGVLGAVEVLEALHRSGAVLVVVAARAHLVRCMADSLKRGESLPWQNTQFVQHVERLADAENGYAQLLVEDAVSLNCTAQSETCKFFADKVAELAKLNAQRPVRSATTARRHPLFVVPDITALSIDASMDTLLKERQFLRSLWVLGDMQDLHRRLDDLITYGCDERQSCGSVCIDEETDSLFSRVVVGVYVLSSCLPSHRPVVLTREMQLSELVLSTDSDGQPRHGLLYNLMDNVLEHYNSISGKLPWRDRCSVGQAMIASDIEKSDIVSLLEKGCHEGALTEQFVREVSAEWDMKGWWTQEMYLWADWCSAEKPWDTLLTRHVNRELLYSVSHDTALTAMPTFESNAARIIGRKRSHGEARQSSGYYNKVFHSLDVTQIRALLDMVRSAQECSRTSTLVVGTLEDVLKGQHPNRNVADVITNRVGSSISDEQKRAVRNLRVEDMPAAVDFLRGQLETRAYMFAADGLHLKHQFNEKQESHISSALAAWTDARGVRPLDRLLSESHSFIMTQRSDCNLLTVLRMMYRSEADLVRRVPLLGALLGGGFPLLCGHYVALRTRLMLWMDKFSHERTGVNAAVHADAVERWEWLTPNARSGSGPTGAALEKWVAPCLGFCRGAQLVSKDRHEEEDETSASEETTTVVPVRGGRGRGRGRGSGRVGQVTAMGIAALSKKKEALLQALREFQCTLTSGEQVARAMKEFLDYKHTHSLSGNDSDVQRAKKLLEELAAAQRELLIGVRSAVRARPLAITVLRACLEGAQGVCNDSDLAAARELNEKVERSLSLVEDAQQRRKVVGRRLGDVKAAIKLLDELRVPHASFDMAAVDASVEEFFASLQAALKMSDSQITALRQFEDGLREDLVPPSPENERQSKQFDVVLSNLNKQDRSSNNAATDALEGRTLKSWEQTPLFYCVALTALVNRKIYHDDAIESMSAFLESSVGTESSYPALCLVVARLVASIAKHMPAKQQKFLQMSCWHRSASVLYTRQMMSPDELARLELYSVDPEADATASDTVLSSESQRHWKRIQDKCKGAAPTALAELMAMTGLETVKVEVLTIYENIMRELQLPDENRMPIRTNLVFVGNPGTGKTTVGKLYGQLLSEIGLREKDNFKRVTGEELVRMGSTKASDTFDEQVNGVLMIDEAYSLKPKTNRGGEAIAMRLLDLAEEHFADRTVILAGYQDDLEKEVMDFNSGFKRRFPYVLEFEDYVEEELRIIFGEMCTARFKVAVGETAVRVAAARLARRRGVKGFGNAGDAYNMAERARNQMVVRLDGAVGTIEAVDIVGTCPSRETNPNLRRALEELESLCGIDAIKERVRDMVDFARRNYDRELAGEPIDELPMNQLFLGSPGTGKTTVAKIYGRVLKELSLLSNGKCNCKVGADFVGQVVGETAQKTKQLIEKCRGGVLLIDEAYTLGNSIYGKEAVDTMVSLVDGRPGEDIAIILVGYDQPMRDMFRAVNEGFSRRFDQRNPFVFADFSNKDLERIAMDVCQDKIVKLPRPVRQAMISELGRMRAVGNFGNAGAVKNLMNVGIAAMRKREQTVKGTAADCEKDTLSVEDLGIAPKVHGVCAIDEALGALYKMDSIRKHLVELSNTLEQCRRDGKPVESAVGNYVFLGSPGTGKTTVARLMARMLFSMGCTANDRCVEISANDLQAGYVGQTKDIVNAKISEAQGGVLFIDEAYALNGSSHGTFLKEAVDQLVAMMTHTSHAGRTVVIIAGYEREMRDMMRTVNPGFSGRFQTWLTFPDWGSDDCVQFIKRDLEDSDMQVAPSAEVLLCGLFAELVQRPGWANARDCKSVGEALYRARANRLVGCADEDPPMYTSADVEAVCADWLSKRPMANPPCANGGNNNNNKQATRGLFQCCAAGAPRQSAQEDARDDLKHQVEELSTEDEEEEKEKEDKKKIRGSDDDPFLAALLDVCRNAGYDSCHERRKELVAILGEVHAGGQFPDAIIGPVVEQMRSSIAAADRSLRPQVPIVLDGMRGAVRAEEERLAELSRLAEAERLAAEERHREMLRTMALCPMGFQWHREGSGWRCNGGSHYVDDSFFMD